jgi:signal transduction histidine kinase
VRRGSDSLAEAARGLGDGGGAAAIAKPPTDELARLADELERTAKRLDESRIHAAKLDASRRELVAWISHDLRTPLARIRAVVEALDDGVVDDPREVGAFHRSLRTETDRLSSLVDQLFELSRINAGALSLDMQELRLADLVSDLLSAFRPLAEARRIELFAELHGSPTVSASTAHIERAISNLLDNAVRYSKAGSSIFVETGMHAGRAYVAITDGCGGISKRELAGLYEEASLRRHGRGANGGSPSGLGLVIAKGLVDAHGGTLSAEGVDGGCRLTVTLPCARESALSAIAE